MAILKAGQTLAVSSLIYSQSIAKLVGSMLPKAALCTEHACCYCMFIYSTLANSVSSQCCITLWRT